MTTHTRSFTRTAIAAAMLAAFGTAQAAEGNDEITALTKPESTIQFGIGNVDRNNRRFGQYSGLRENSAYGLIDADIVQRNDATGTWLRLKGRNLGLESRELRFDHERQGNWGYYIEYSKTPRYEPYQALTGATGIGTNNLTIPNPAATIGQFDLKTVRDRVGLGFSKQLADRLNVKVDFRNEEKQGARVWGRGTTGGPGRFEFMPEPLQTVTRQLDVILGYTGDRLQLSGGYYGSAFSNDYNAIFITGGNPGLSAAPNNFINPIALPPDNQAHQFHLSGGYRFTPTTQGSFKVAYAKATQEDAFLTAAQLAPTPVAPGGLPAANLGGRIDTTLVQMGLVSRPLPKLTLRGSLRYNDRNDKTPVLGYGTPQATTDGANEPRSIRTTNGKLEASYALPMAFRLTGGFDYEEKKRNTSPFRVVSFRDTTEETTWRAELRRSLSDTVTGAVGYTYSERTGSAFQNTLRSNTPLPGTSPGSNIIAPIHLADRDREKMRVSANWQVADPLSLQFLADKANDRYDGSRDGSGLGVRKGKASLYSVDASLAMSENWQATAYASHSRNSLDQATCESASNPGVCSNTAGNPLWRATLSNQNKTFGMGLRGKPYSWLDLGADFSLSDIKDVYQQSVISPAGAPIAVIPDVITRLTRLQFYAKYAIRKNSGIRLDYIHDRFSTNDWTWSSFTFTDGTQLIQNPVQKTNFVGLSYYHRWQ